MTISLYEATVPNYLQILNATAKLLQKGKQYCDEKDIDIATIVEKRLIEDMQPFRFQVISVAHHSMGAMHGIESGEFTPPIGYGDPDFDGLVALVNKSIKTISSYDADTVNSWAGNSLTFKVGGNELLFTAENFVHTFSMPNFHFHAATAYDLLRMTGVPLGKRDFLGALRMGA